MTPAQQLARENAIEELIGLWPSRATAERVLERLETAGLVVGWRDAQALEDTVTEGLRQGDRVRHSSGWVGEVMWSRVHYLHTVNAGSVRVVRTRPSGDETFSFVREDRLERVTEEQA